MGRLIEVRPKPKKVFVPEAAGRTQEATKAADTDTVTTRIVKLVPTEIVAGYIPLVAAAEAITDNKETQFTLACIAFFAGLVLTPIYLIYSGKPSGLVQWLNVAIATVAFV